MTQLKKKKKHHAVKPQTVKMWETLMEIQQFCNLKLAMQHFNTYVFGHVLNNLAGALLYLCGQIYIFHKYKWIGCVVLAFCNNM